MRNLFYEQLEKQSNGTDLKEFAIEELEKIKAEITEYRNNIHAGSDEFHIGRLFGCDEMVEIIDKHISELKGESNANNKTD